MQDTVRFASQRHDETDWNLSVQQCEQRGLRLLYSHRPHALSYSMPE